MLVVIIKRNAEIVQSVFSILDIPESHPDRRMSPTRVGQTKMFSGSAGFCGRGQNAETFMTSGHLRQVNSSIRFLNENTSIGYIEIPRH